MSNTPEVDQSWQDSDVEEYEFALDNMDDENVDAAGIPPMLEVDDPVAQEEVLHAMLQGLLSKTDSEADFVHTPVTQLKVSSLQTIYTTKNRRAALHLLNKRTSVKLAEDAVIHPNDPDLLWENRSHFLDLLILVSKDIGLGAILPSVENDHTYSFTLDIQQHRQWSAKYALLGFVPVANMLYIGKLNMEDIWLAWVPSDSLRHGTDTPSPGCHDTSSCLSSPHFWMVYMFLAGMLNDAQFAAVTVTTDYPEANRRDVEHATNML